MVFCLYTKQWQARGAFLFPIYSMLMTSYNTNTISKVISTKGVIFKALLIGLPTRRNPPNVISLIDSTTTIYIPRTKLS